MLDPNTHRQGRFKRDTVLLHAAERGQAEVARVLLDHGANPNHDSGFGRFRRGRTPLSAACEAGQFDTVDTVRVLLTHERAKANPNQPTEGGNYPIHHTVRLRKTADLLVLLDHGASPNVSNMHGQTPLHVASTDGFVEGVKLLHRFEAKVDATLPTGYTPLHCAAARGHMEIVTLLVNSCGADVNAKGTNGMTPLDVAQCAGHQEIVHFLSKHR
jgi:ankyrin repeat protein